MKKNYAIIIILLFAVGLKAANSTPIDNLHINFGAGLLVGDNGQPTSISNIAVAWDANIGYWLGTSKYAGIRLGYTGDVLQSFNYIGNKSYGWNTLYVDGLLNLSNLICKTKLSNRDPLWYCSPFISLECLIPMANNQYKTSLGFGLGLTNEINVHQNISVTLDWRNTFAFADGHQWMPEVSAGLRVYFTGRARNKKSVPLPLPSDSIDCQEHLEEINSLNDEKTYMGSQIKTLEQEIATIKSDTSIYQLGDNVISNFVRLVGQVPYRHKRVDMAITIIPIIKDNGLRKSYAETQTQLSNYYDLTKELYDIIYGRQQQLESAIRSIWITGFISELSNFQNNHSYDRLPYLKNVIEKVEKEMKQSSPDFSDIIAELGEALQTKK